MNKTGSAFNMMYTIVHNTYVKITISMIKMHCLSKTPCTSMYIFDRQGKPIMELYITS